MDSTSQPVDKRKLTRSLVGVVLFGFLCLQIFRWQTYAFEVTWLSLKSMTIGLSFQNHVRFGSICNSIQNYECSSEHFQEALSMSPKHLSSMGNLAIAQSHLEDFAQATTAFEHYFQAGGLAYDVMHFYARHLIKNGQFDRGVQWLYRSLSVHTSNQEVANELIDRLTLEEKFYEALSLTGALVEVDPTTRDFWKSKQMSLMQFLETQTSLKKETQSGVTDDTTSIHIPSLDGKSFFVPVRFDATTPWNLFLIDRGESQIVVSAEILSKWSYELYEKLKPQLQDPKAKVKFELKQLRVGPWTLENVEAILCEKCQSRLGRAIFNHLDVQKGQDQISDFITIQPRKEEESE